MITDVNIEKIFPKHLFWDVDMACLDIEKDRDLIIPRALMATTSATFETDISKLEKLYPKSTIAQELKSTSERISNHVCDMLADRYHIKPFSRFAK